MKLVLVEWIDSHSGPGGWRNLTEIKEELASLRIISVGWLLGENRSNIQILPHVYAEQEQNIIKQGRGDMVIPKCAIQRLTYLRVPRVSK